MTDRLLTERVTVQAEAIRLFGLFASLGDFEKAEMAADMAFVVVHPPPGRRDAQRPGVA